MEYRVHFGKFSLISLWNLDRTGLYGKGSAVIDQGNITLTGTRYLSVWYQAIILLTLMSLLDLMFGASGFIGAIITFVVIAIFGKRPYEISFKLTEIKHVLIKKSEAWIYTKKGSKDTLASILIFDKRDGMVRDFDEEMRGLGLVGANRSKQ